MVGQKYKNLTTKIKKNRLLDREPVFFNIIFYYSTIILVVFFCPFMMTEQK